MTTPVAANRAAIGTSAAAREALVDELAEIIPLRLFGDPRRLRACPRRRPGGAAAGPVVGQDIQAGDDGIFRIAREVAKDRVISVVDPDARHGHKTAARKFDGFKGHVAVDPDSEIIAATVVSPGNAGDASAAADLIADLLPTEDTGTVADTAPALMRWRGPKY